MKRLSLIFVLGITMLTACMPVAGAVDKPPAGEVTITSSPSGMDAQTIAPLPSNTPRTPTAQPTETVAVTATLAVSPDMVRLASVDYKKWEKPSTAATIEDWASGRLLAFAQSIATPFSDKVMNMDFGMSNFTEGSDQINFTRQYVLSNGKTFDSCSVGDTVPMKWLAHFFIPADPKNDYLVQPLYLDIAQYKNKDKSNGFVIYYTIEGSRRDILFGKMAYTMPVRVDKSTTKHSLAEGENIMTDIGYYHADNINAALDEWKTTGNLPTYLQTQLLHPSITYTDKGVGCFDK